VAIVIAVQALAQEGDGPEVVHHYSNADLNELGVIPMPVRDVSWGEVISRRPGSGRRSWPRGLVGPGENEMGGVEVEAVEREVGEADGPGSDGRQDGVALAEESVEGSAQTVVVEALGGDVPEEVGPRVRGPGGDVDQGRGLAEAGGEQEAEDAAVGERQLGVRGQVVVNEGGDVKTLEQRSNQSQRAPVQSIVRERGAMPGLSHDASAGKGWQERQGGRLRVAQES
jgi:hypothetical protein